MCNFFQDEKLSGSEEPLQKRIVKKDAVRHDERGRTQNGNVSNRAQD